MEDYGHLSREELISLIREMKAARGSAGAPAGERPEAFAVFSEWHQREFDRSPWPMRIFEHGTFRFLAVNDAAVRLYGYSREEFLKLTARDTRHVDEHAEFLTTLNEPTEYLRHRGARRHIRKNGEIIVVEAVTQDVLFDGVRARLSMNIDVTERDRVQALLQRREREFESLMAHAPDVVCRLDRDFRHQYVNSAITAVTGRAPDEFIGKSIAEVGMTPDLVARWHLVLTAAFATGREQSLECVYEGPGGEGHYESRIIPEKDAGGGVKSVLTITRDFTERKRVEELLWRREQEFESLAENLPDLVARFDHGHRYIYVNSAVERLLGRPRHELCGKTQRELGMPEALVTTFEHSLDETIDTGKLHKIEFSVLTPQGERSFEAYHVPERNSALQMTTVLCVARDVTERKMTENIQSRLAAIVSSTADAIIAKNLDGVIQTWNPGAERLFGYRADEVVGKSIIRLIPPERQGEEELILERIRRGEQVEHFESVRIKKDGAPVHVSLTISPIKSQMSQVIGASSIARDITERRHAELAMLRNASLAQLLESLARAANEAVTPEAAMIACLGLICRHGNWVIGRVALYGESGPKDFPLQSIWHCADRDRFAEFIRISEGQVINRVGSFISRVAWEHVPVWVEDLKAVPGFGRRAAAVKYGLNSAFAFPIIARGTVVAIIEVFSEKARSQDPLTMGAAQSIASQLARIVERERARQVNARMAAIVESSHDAIISRALDGTILTWNVGAERLFGYTAAEIVGRSLVVLYPPELKAKLFSRQKLVLQGKAMAAFETVRIAKDGRRVQVSLSSAPIRDSNGEAWGISTIMQDISERKIAEQDLSESRERLKWVLEATGIGLWLNPLPLTDLNWDSHTRELFFLPPGAKPTARWFWERLHQEDREPTRLAIEAALRNKTLYAIDHRAVNPKTGEIRWIRSAGKAIYDASGAAIRFDGINYDITEEKQAESERLEHAVRQRDALVREVHHRIKNSLQGVIGLLGQKIRKNPAIAPEIEETIGQLQSVALVYGLQETRPDGLLSLAEIMDAICSSAEDLIGGRVERTVERKSGRPACLAGSEAVSVAYALNELVFNALKHQRAVAGNKRVRVSVQEAKGAVEIRISNRGRLPNNFDFANGRAVGNGLGLVRTLLAAPGGAIEFKNGGNEVEVVLKLGPPLLAVQFDKVIMRTGNGETGKEKNTTAHTGGRRRPARVGGTG